MKALIAADSFKGCMSSQEANRQIEKGLHKAGIEETETFVISDGGEGMAEAVGSLPGFEMKTLKARDLYGRHIQAQAAWNPAEKTACLDAASVLGVTLYPQPERKPMSASSLGLGMLMRQVMKLRPQTMIIGLGGTGTNDGGMGLLCAFGAVFYDENHAKLHPCAANLSRIAFIDKRGFFLDKRVKIIAACDVVNPLLGQQGATHIFGKQKGLNLRQIRQTESGMEHLAAKIRQTFHVKMDDFPGSGAAGGLGGMLGSVFGAEITNGIDILDQAGGLKERIAASDVVFTGEGQTDEQSTNGKAVFRIAQMASEAGVPVVCLSGALGLGYEKMTQYGVTALFSTADRAMSFPQALKQGPQKLEQAAENTGRLMLAFSCRKGFEANEEN